MNRCLPLLLILLLLCGCAAQDPLPASATLPLAAAIPETPSLGFYDAGNILEIQTQGALQVYPLQGKQAIGLFPLDDSLLLLSAAETGTELTLLSGDLLLPSASLNPDVTVNPEDISVYPETGRISFWNPDSRQIILLDFFLQEVARLDVPQDLIGNPVFSPAQNTLYYCTATAVRAQDLSTGISRILKEIHNPYQTAIKLLLSDTILQIQTTDAAMQSQYLFLSTQSGQLLQQSLDSWQISTLGTSFYAQYGASLLYGTDNEALQILHPKITDTDCWFLPEIHQAVTVSPSADGKTALDQYDLATGKCTASVLSDVALHPSQAAVMGGSIWFLDGSTIYRWNTNLSPAENASVYTDRYYTQQIPDDEGLAACTQYAQALGDQYGVEILIYKDAVCQQPREYDLEYEHSVPILKRELALLDVQLSQYPKAVMQALSSRFPSITICLVDKISGSPESGNTDPKSGILFWEDYHAYIVLAAEQSIDKTLHRQLYHLIDTVVLTESIAYDQWDKLNPSGFQYTYGAFSDGSPWPESGKESFINAESIHSPKEDRAKIMEYAMTDGHESLFQSPYLQAKLRQICIGIRDAFHLKNENTPFLWEQYLQTPLN